MMIESCRKTTGGSKDEMEWYYIKNGNRLGPVGSEEMAELVRIGKVVSEDLVWRIGFQKWKKACEVDGLFSPPPMPSEGLKAADPQASHAAHAVKQASPQKGMEKVSTVGETQNSKPKWKSDNPSLQVLGWILVVFWFAVFKVFGMSLIIPTLGGFVVAWLAGRLIDPAAKPMLTALGVQAGEIILSIVEILYRRSPKDIGFLLDLAIVGGGMVWIVRRPGVVPVLLLSIYQLLMVGYGVVMLESGALSEAVQRVAIVHVAFKLLAVIAMVAGLVIIRRNRRLQRTAAPSPSP